MADILCVGIDIGTSTTQLVFSQITLENITGYFSVPHISITHKEVIYRSKVYLTPLLTQARIDGSAILRLVEQEYQTAGVLPEDVDTGAVIITGESACKENAKTVLEHLSMFAGEFVVSTAGPDLESIIAGKGSGAYQYSLENGCSVVNLDIGGGTTNLVLFENGIIRGTGCFNIGGRLIRLARDFEVESVSPPAARIAEYLGIDLRIGKRTDENVIRRITDKMADLLAQVLELKEQEPILRELQTAQSSWLDLSGRQVDRICFSGGVADCFDTLAGNTVSYGDIGIFLGHSIRDGLLAHMFPHIQSAETIRATVVGAGTYTTSISGSTIACAEKLFPIKNVPVLKLDEREQTWCWSGEQGFLSERVRWFLKQCGSDILILAMTGERDPDYVALTRLTDYLVRELDESLPPGQPVLIVLEEDMAKALGLLLEKQLAGRRLVACIDGIRVEQGDYVDMGKPIMGGLVIPVIIKTLLFG